MEKYFYLLLIVTLFSCKRSSNTPTPISELSFSADGVSHSYSGDWDQFGQNGCLIDSLSLYYPGYFALAGVTNMGHENFYARVHAASVEAKSYTDVRFEAYLNGLHYLVSSDCLVSISKIENGRADGTFSGKIAQSPSLVVVNITNGVFKNVLIR